MRNILPLNIEKKYICCDNMNLKGSEAQYGVLAQFLHWSSVILIFLLIPIGLLMKRISEESLKVSFYKLHIFLGILIFILTLMRVIWIFFDIRPPHPSNMSSLHFNIYKLVHILIYLVLFLLSLQDL